MDQIGYSCMQTDIQGKKKQNLIFWFWVWLGMHRHAWIQEMSLEDSWGYLI